jgi:hypothetical protein
MALLRMATIGALLRCLIAVLSLLTTLVHAGDDVLRNDAEFGLWDPSPGVFWLLDLALLPRGLPTELSSIRFGCLSVDDFSAIQRASQDGTNR